MHGLIQKSGYIKQGSGAGNYTEYIATRDGVELINGGGQYMEYIAERPRSHGLFSNAKDTDLKKTMQEVAVTPLPSGHSSTLSNGRMRFDWGTTLRRVGKNSSWLTKRNWQRR